MSEGQQRPRGWFFKRKGFWELTEIAGVFGAAISAAVTATSSQTEKTIPARVTGLFALVIAASKVISKWIEWRDKAIREKQAAKEEQTRQVESDRMRLHYADQARRMVKPILDAFHKEYFRREDDDEIHKHRVTLFVCTESDGPAGGGKRLTILARSGVYQDSTISWPLDDNEKERCRGIAAKIWFDGVSNVKTAACDWSDDENSPLRVQYADSLGITVAEAQALNVKSKVFTGARLIVKDQKWGVVLLDSLKAGQITDERHQKGLLRKYAELLGSVLNGMIS